MPHLTSRVACVPSGVYCQAVDACVATCADAAMLFLHSHRAQLTVNPCRCSMPCCAAVCCYFFLCSLWLVVELVAMMGGYEACKNEV